MGMMQRLTRRMRLRVAMLLAFAIVTIAAALLVPLPGIDQVRASAAEGGIGAAAIFSVGYAVASLTPIPKNVVSIAAGVVWGLAVGFALVYLGALLGATLAFAISRVLGREVIERMTGARAAKVHVMLSERGFAAVLGARLIPLMPFTVLNYTAGFTSVRMRDYTLGTMLGMIPGTLAYVAVGAYGITLQWPLFVAMGALGVLTVVGAVYAAHIGVRTRAAAAGARAHRGVEQS